MGVPDPLGHQAGRAGRDPRYPGPDRDEASAMTHPALHPWRILILDRERGDPKWILATVATPDDVRPARPGATVDEVTTAWVASAASLFHPALTPLLSALCWRVDEGR
jgi:hypothetical protein